MFDQSSVQLCAYHDHSTCALPPPPPPPNHLFDQRSSGSTQAAVAAALTAVPICTQHTTRLHDRRRRRRVGARNERLLLSVNRSLPSRTDGARSTARTNSTRVRARAQRGTVYTIYALHTQQSSGQRGLPCTISVVRSATVPSATDGVNSDLVKSSQEFVSARVRTYTNCVPCWPKFTPKISVTRTQSNTHRRADTHTHTPRSDERKSSLELEWQHYTHTHQPTNTRRATRRRLTSVDRNTETC